MRVLFAAKHFHYPQGGGGLERNTHELCLRLVKQGLKPAVMCDLEPEFSYLALRNRIARKLQPAIRFPMDIGVGYPVYRGWGGDDGAREVASRFQPDVVIAQSARPVPLLDAFAGLGIHRTAYFHEVMWAQDVAAIVQMGGVGLLANSEFTAGRMAQHGPIRPAVIRPLIDPAFYLTQPAPKNVLFINTALRKGVEIAFQLAENRRDVQFDIVRCPNKDAAVHGLAWDTPTLEARARASGNITLHQPTNDLRPLYARARLVLVPSLVEEAWGRVATEAQINGIPVLASGQGGLPEAVGPGGLLVAHDAPIEMWKDAFTTLWDDPSEHARYAAAALAYSKRSEIQPDTIVKTFIDTVKTFIDGHAASKVDR